MTDSNIKKELDDEDARAGDSHSGETRREIFERVHGGDALPDREPQGSPPHDDTPPPPDSNEPLREPRSDPDPPKKSDE